MIAKKNLYYFMQKTSLSWHGVMPALTTKFNDQDKIDFDLHAHNVEEQIKAGVSGIILAGSLGEVSTLSFDEIISLTKNTVDIVQGRVPVIMNIAVGSTAEGKKMAENGEKIGASGFMLLPPMRYKADEKETVTFFGDISQATNLPIMIYNNPIDYKIEVTLEMFDQLSKYASIQAIKESTRDVTNITRLKNKFGDRYAIFCGVDTLSLESILLGADGLVAGLVCAFPNETIHLYNLAKAGKIEEALKLYRWFLPLLELDIHPKLVQNIKLAEQMVGLGTEYVRRPRMILEGAERDQVLGVIQKALDNRPIL